MVRIFTMILCIFLLCSCSFSNENADILLVTPESEPTQTEISLQATYIKLSADEAYNMMETEESFILIDVRTEEEYKEKRIAGSILIPDYEIDKRAESDLPDKNALILIYCRSGRRSADAANKLIDMGYTNVYDFGGIIDWPYDTIND